MKTIKVEKYISEIPKGFAGIAEWPDGSKRWFVDGKYHREDGPAVEYSNGSKWWYLNGKEVTWQQVYRQAKNPEIELRILSAVLTNA